jgi:NTP pyrophosphatase (non-canonical NTP hydrolase)
MTLDEYQAAALTTAQWSGDDLKDLSHWTLGVTGEAGEIAEKVKKIIRDADGEVSPEAKKELMKEIGDVMWYLSTLSHHLGYKFSEVGQHNIDKLADRKTRNQIHGNGDNR